MYKSRSRLALVVITVVLTVAVFSVLVPAAFPVFDRLVPALMLVLGYYFGQIK